jgi:hypothetical protein
MENRRKHCFDIPVWMKLMKIPRKIASLAVAIVASGALFYYLSETLIQWRIVFSTLMFLATYIMIDGFLRHA